VKPVEVEGVEEWKIEKILNKRKVRGVVKYLVQWKGFMAEHDSWKREEDLENTKEVVAELEGRVNIEVRQQEQLDMAKEKNFRKRELPGKYMVKMLYGWDDGKFEKEYLRKLERNWQKWKSVSLEEKFQREDDIKNAKIRLYFILFSFQSILFLELEVRDQWDFTSHGHTVT